jgi:uncharacterized membrane protein HdeD (DUF308 family)
MTHLTVERRRTGWDIALGLVLVVLAFVVLGHAVVATVVSVLFLGWVLLISGLALLVASFFRIRHGGFWSAALGGGILAVLGLVLLRNTGAAILTLTLVTGALIFAEGLIRLVSAVQRHQGVDRWVLVASGAVSVGLGLFVLFNLVEASFVLLGVLLGVQTLLDGLTLIAVGRLRVSAPEPVPGTARSDA